MDIRFSHELIVVSLAAVVGLLSIMMVLIVYITRRGVAAGVMLPDSAQNLVRNLIVIIIGAALAALGTGIEASRDVRWGEALGATTSIFGIVAGIIALVATRTRLKVGDMKSLVWAAALVLVTGFVTARADAQIPAGTQPFAGTWSCKTDGNRAVRYSFVPSTDGKWIVLDTTFANGNATAELQNSYRQDASGAWTAMQHIGGHETFLGHATGWQNAAPWNAPSLAFNGKEKTAKGSVNERQTWVIDSNGTLEHIWSVYDGSNYVPTSTTYCKKA